MTYVRQINSLEDFDDLVLLAEKMHEENANHLDFDPIQLRYYFELVRYKEIRKEYNGYIAYTDEDKAIGFIIGVCCPYFFSKQIMAKQELWYVDPAHRNGKVALSLMRVFERWAISNGAVEIYTGVSIIGDIERASKVGKLLTMVGYPVTGSYHTRVVKQNLGDRNATE